MVKNKRYYNYDLLKIICCIIVIGIHIGASYVKLAPKNPVINEIYQNNLLYITFWYIFPRISVPCFIMISGSFILSKKNNQSYKRFYKKTIVNIIIPTVLFSLFYLLIGIIQTFIGIEQNNISTPISNFIKGTSNESLWYLYMVIGIYLLVPLILKIKNNIKFDQFKNLAWIYLIITAPGNLASCHDIKWSIGLSVSYLGYFMIGYIIKEEIKDKQNNKKAISFITLGIITIFIDVFFKYITQISTNISINSSSIIFENNFNPFIMISSILIFKGFSYLKFNKNIENLSKLTYPIYLIHIFVLLIIDKITKKYMFIINPSILIPIKTLLVFVISMFISNIYLFIKDKIENKTNVSIKIADKIINKIEIILNK